MYKYTLIFTFFIFFECLSQQINFDAKGILILCDGDLQPSTLIDGKVNKEKGNRDQLISIKLPIERDSEEQKPTFLSNSLYCKNAPMATSSDSKFAFIIDCKGSQVDSISQFKNIHNDLPNGQFMYVVDINDPQKVVIKHKIPVGKNPHFIKSSPKGNEILILSSDYTKELIVLNIDEQGKPNRSTNKPSGILSGEFAAADWHPSGNFIAAINKSTNEVVFIEVKREGKGEQIYRLDVFGSAIKVGKKLNSCQFTKDGNFLIINDEAGENETFKMFSMKFDIQNKQFPLMHSIETEFNADNFEITKDNLIFVACNENTTNSKQPRPNGFIEVLSIDSEGNFKMQLKEAVSGIYPNSIAIDKTENNLAISQFEFSNFGKKIGGVDFYSIERKPTLKLTKQVSNYITNRGPHSILIIR